MSERLRQVPLFAELSDDDLARISQDVEEVTLSPGELLFREGDAGDTAYVVEAGEVDVVKAMGRRETLLAVRGPGAVIGEMAFWQQEPRIASVRARTATTLLAIPRSVLDALMVTSPSAMRSVVRTLLGRLHDTNDRLRQSERLAQLGTLTAGIAHELNNPAAGARRAAERLTEAVAALGQAFAAAADLDARHIRRVVELAGTGEPTTLDALTHSDREAAVEDWLDDRGIADGWRLASQLVDAGCEAADLEDLTQDLDRDQTTTTLHLLAWLSQPRSLAQQVATGTQRISDIVGRLKSHAYLDRAPIQPVDLHRGLDDTLMLLAHQLGGVRVIRKYGADVPVITAAGGELNQVWTNLLDNAAYALLHAGTADPVIAIRTLRDGDDVVVEVEDNGPGIPADIRDHVFDAFLTTKPPGEGTGQGLNLSYQIVVLDHGGSLTVDSVPGSTIFRVVLPITPAAGSQAS